MKTLIKGFKINFLVRFFGVVDCEVVSLVELSSGCQFIEVDI